MSQQKLADFLDSLEKLGIPACDCLVYHDHRSVFRHTVGYADVRKTKPLSSSTTYWLFSASKLITCTAVMQLVEKGAIHLDDPVSDYLPEYARLNVRNGSKIEPAENVMTIRHLLSMQSGLNYNLDAPSIRSAVESTGGQASTRQIIQALAGEPLDFEPGTHFQYSLSHDVLGAVIEVASGQRFGAYLDEHILQPLGMKSTGFKMTADRKERLAQPFMYDAEAKTTTPMTTENNYALTCNYESGGAGLISTADDYMRFLDAMCFSGVSADGCRILSRESIDQMRTDQLNEASRKDFDRFERPGYSYGLGCRTLIERKMSGVRSPLGEFGWDGAAGAYALIDTQNHLAIFYAQHVRGSHFVYHDVHPKIRDLTYEMLGIGNR